MEKVEGLPLSSIGGSGVENPTPRADSDQKILCVDIW